MTEVLVFKMLYVSKYSRTFNTGDIEIFVNLFANLSVYFHRKKYIAVSFFSMLRAFV